MAHLNALLRCNLTCTGCSHGSVLGAKNPRPDIEAMATTLASFPAGEDVVFHGGEPLMLRAEEAEALCQAAKEQGRKIHMQTNATMLTAHWLRLIEHYEISVGVSLNGPGRLNRARRAGSDEVTDRMTARVHEACEKLAKMDRLNGLIVVLSTHNAGTDEDLETLIDWARGYVGGVLGCWSIRWNPLYGESELSPERLTAVYQRLLTAAVASPKHQWLPFREYIDNLSGLGLSPCWMKPCDPYKTEAVHGINTDGSEGSCLRMSPDGIPWQRAAEQSFVRQDILFQIPMAEGGCGGCRYWNFCHGGCPAEAVGDDWRNKSRWCGTILATYEAIETGLGGWLPNWRSAADWEAKDPGALATSIENRTPLIKAFGAMDPGAHQASTFHLRTVPAD
jgi:uncharacterized protein